MSLAVVAVYCQPLFDKNSPQIGLDYWHLHARRMQFARDAVFSPQSALPGWYPREFLGTPFWANVQNFPFIPTRLLVLLTMDPAGSFTYAIAVTLSAVLAALFTYLYVRKIGLGLIASAAAGWTFACNGFYAARIAAGHLPLLEAYPALPLLLWVAESLIQAEERDESPRRWIVGVALSTSCLMLAGHPQLAAYSLGIACLYVVSRGGLWRAVRTWGFMALGVGIAAFALIPMGMLVGRSTRVLALAVPHNDVPMPYGRLAAFFFPWRDGAPRPLGRALATPFAGYPNWAYFWETVSYSGLLPWIALALLCWLVTRSKLRKPEEKIAIFVVVLAITGILLSLPFIHSAMSLIPATIFRSPARLVYLTEFALAVALGMGVHTAFMAARHRIARFLVPCLLIVHGWDVGVHSREFILRAPSRAVPETFAGVLKDPWDGRVAMDFFLAIPVNRMVDDVGFFDSIMLARTYQTVLSLANLPADLNIQSFNGSEMSSRALAAVGVKLMITAADRRDLKKKEQIGEISIYKIPLPSQRAEFFDAGQIRYLPTDQLHAMLRNPGIDLRSVLLLPGQAPSFKAGRLPPREAPKVQYRRPDSDHIEITVKTGRSGFLRVIESWDPGWSATVDGVPVPIVAAMDALMAVPVAAGNHEVRFVYRTPGAGIGGTLSITSLGVLCYLIWISGRNRLDQKE